MPRRAYPDRIRQSAATGPAGGGELQAMLPLLGELGDLKRVRAADGPGSLAERAFRRAWAALVEGRNPETVAHDETARGLAAARLGGIDLAALRLAGLAGEQGVEVLRDAFDAVAGSVAEPLRATLRRSLGSHLPSARAAPDFVTLLAEQPRAGATRPGRPRLIVGEPESHADHCATVAIYGVLLSPIYGAEPAQAYLCGLAHHLHNARWPDAGFAADALLGARLDRVMERLRADALRELPPALRRPVEHAVDLVFRADTPEARAFQAADVLDRVLQMEHYARAAAFTLDQALEEMDLVHPGPVQGFHLTVLEEAGFRRRSAR